MCKVDRTCCSSRHRCTQRPPVQSSDSADALYPTAADLTSQIPSTSILAPVPGPSIFALPSDKFATLDWDQPDSLASDMARAVQFLHQTILVTALSVLCAVRTEEQDGLWENDDVPTVAEGFSFCESFSFFVGGTRRALWVVADRR